MPAIHLATTNWYNSPVAEILPNLVTGIIGFGIGVTLFTGCYFCPQSLTTCFSVSKWLAVSIAGLVAIKLLRDVFCAFETAMLTSKKEGWRRFAFSASFTIAAPIAGGIACALLILRTLLP